MSDYYPRVPEIESRSTSKSVKALGPMRIGGYAAKFGTRSNERAATQGIVEVVEPSFFNKSRGDGWPGVLCRYEHDRRVILGASDSGTLQLNITREGLDYTCLLPESRSDVYESISRGDVANSSFAFQCFTDDFRYEDGGSVVRHLISGRLLDVAPTAAPAYSDTSVQLRSLARQFDIHPDDVFALAERSELRSLFVRTDQMVSATTNVEPGHMGDTQQSEALDPNACLAILESRRPPTIYPDVAMRLLDSRRKEIDNGFSVPVATGLDRDGNAMDWHAGQR